jgi:predicted porin
MKKTLIALAALGAMAGAAHAQSSVTLYGIVDIGLLRADSLNDTWNVQSGNVSGSRWGLKGSEDLGGGLKANFTLEQGFSLDTGGASDPTRQFNRQAWVGVSGGWGEVQIGRIYTAYDDVSGAINAMWDSTWSVENNFFNSTTYGGAGDGRINNGIRYATPSFGGFVGAVSYSLDENKATKLNNTAISLAYANGPFAAGFGYEVNEVGGGVIDPRKVTRFSASYDLGVVVLKGLYGNVKNPYLTNLGKTNEYSIGADMPLGGAFTLSAAYGYSKDSVNAGGEKRKGFTIGGQYVLSKRTDVFVGVTDWEGKVGGIKVPGREDTKYGAAIRHRF